MTHVTPVVHFTPNYGTDHSYYHVGGPLRYLNHTVHPHYAGYCKVGKYQDKRTDWIDQGVMYTIHVQYLLCSIRKKQVKCSITNSLLWRTARKHLKHGKTKVRPDGMVDKTKVSLDYDEKTQANPEQTCDQIWCTGADSKIESTL